jgi:hypothetical protein
MPIKTVRRIIGKKTKAIKGMSVDAVSAVANWSLLASLVVGVIATYAIVITSNIKEDRLKQRLAIAAKEAALTNERAAILTKEAAEARTEQERLKQSMAWRRLSKEQHDSLVSSLTGQGIETIGLLVLNSDPESTQYASDIQVALKAASIKVKRITSLAASGNDFGLYIGSPEDSKEFKAVAQAFGNAKVSMRFAAARKELEIIVGPKPPPF